MNNDWFDALKQTMNDHLESATKQEVLRRLQIAGYDFYENAVTPERILPEEEFAFDSMNVSTDQGIYPVSLAGYAEHGSVVGTNPLTSMIYSPIDVLESDSVNVKIAA